MSIRSMKRWMQYFREHEINSSVEEIKKLAPQLSGAMSGHILSAWEDFSGSMCASFLIVSKETVEQFLEWLELKEE